jgi:glycosyltransferase involved in cell wall biosynthesis
LAEQKHIPLLINLAKNLLEDGIQFELNIVGDGPEKTKLDQLVRQLELENHVHFLGRTQDVSNFMNSLDMFLLTSRYEGFGLVLLEAIDHGLPIVASNTSAIPEVLGERHPGLFPVGDLETLTYRVTSFLRNSAKRKACVEYQYSRLKRFTVNEYFERHEDIYNAFLRQKL